MDVCPECFNNNKTLKATIERQGRSGICNLCKVTRDKVLCACELRKLFVPLTKFYSVAREGVHFCSYTEGDETFSEGDQGELLVAILQHRWRVFAETTSEDDIEAILREVWPGYINRPYASGSLNRVYLDYEWRKLKQRLKHKRRFFLQDGYSPESQLLLRLKTLSSSMTSAMEDSKWSRARIQQSSQTPFSLSEMGAPPSNKATQGRANPAGISYLYLASDGSTACAEVRAEPGHYVTIASVTIPGKIKVLNLVETDGQIDPFGCSDISQELDKTVLMREFASELSRPVLADDAPLEYVPTQYLAEFFVHNKIDAIYFSSSVADGCNLVLFDPSKARLTDCKSVRVTKKTLALDDVPQTFSF